MNNYYAYISKITNLKNDVLKSLDFIDWKAHVKKDSTVFIKPNFTYPFYKEGITTNPELLKPILELLSERADKVILGESNGGNNSFSAAQAFEGHNLNKICDDLNIDLINLSNSPWKPVEDVICGKRVKVLLPKILLSDIDCFISIPVLKVHVMTGVSLSIKNLWGCYPDPMRCLHHKHLSYKLALITKILNPKLVVVDGIHALNGHGPMYGEPKKTNLILSSNNSLVCDSLSSSIMGINPAKIDHIMVAERNYLGTTDLSQVNINCDWQPFKMQFSINKTLMDKLSLIPFNSEFIAKVALESPLTPMIYKAVRHLKNSQELIVAEELKKFKHKSD